MELLKPMYGQADAPREWYLEAKQRFQSCKFKVHPLDPCCYLAFGENDQLCGIVILHVDDMLIAGGKDFKPFESELKKKFNFRTWKELETDGQPIEYCGGQLYATQYALILDFSEYINKVKPITIAPHRKDEDLATNHEVRQLRGLIGALQWPATQACPHLACSVSMHAAKISNARIQDLKEANKTLRFAKSNNQSQMVFPKESGNKQKNPFDQTGFLALSDAAWATRSDGSSQGGYLILAVDKTAFNDKMAFSSILEWKSFKLHRVSRSSLNAETQAAAEAADALEHVKVFWNLLQDPSQHVLQMELRKSGVRVNAIWNENNGFMKSPGNWMNEFSFDI